MVCNADMRTHNAMASIEFASGFSLFILINAGRGEVYRLEVCGRWAGGGQHCVCSFLLCGYEYEINESLIMKCVL